MAAPAANLPPLAEAPAQPQAAPEPSRVNPSLPGMMRPSIPYLQGTALTKFGSRATTYLVQDFAFNIDVQNTVATSTYNQMQVLVPVNFAMTLQQFIRMWKTLILKRVQDVYEREKHIRPEHYVRIDRSILVPAPLSDLMSAIGSFDSHSRGVTYHVTPPARAAQPPDWWTVDDNVVTLWVRLMHRMKHLYLMREYPSPADFDSRPLALTTIRTELVNNQVAARAVYAYTNEPTPADALVRFVNDDMYENAHGITQANCGYIIVERSHYTAVVLSYIGSYVLNTVS